MSRKTIFDYARAGALAEQRLMELLDSALRDELSAGSSETDLQDSAEARRAKDSSGRET